MMSHQFMQFLHFISLYLFNFTYPNFLRDPLRLTISASSTRTKPTSPIGFFDKLHDTKIMVAAMIMKQFTAYSIRIRLLLFSIIVATR